MIRLTYEEKSCKGLVYRAAVSGYLDSRNQINFHVRLRKLKKKSCSGCEQCGGLIECLNEDAVECRIEGLVDVEHGKLYRLIIVEDSRDYETGYCDDWHLKLVEFKEDSANGKIINTKEPK